MVYKSVKVETIPFHVSEKGDGDWLVLLLSMCIRRIVGSIGAGVTK
jgi:hypothetical protein